MIRSVALKNFKSLVDFELKMERFTCLIGLNGSGKSTVLQAMDFIRQMMEGDMERWLQYRHWEGGDLLSRLSPEKRSRSTLFCRVSVDTDNNESGSGRDELTWEGTFNPAKNYLRCTSETVMDAKKNLLLQVKDGRYHLGDGSFRKIEFDYQGSLLSGLNESTLKEHRSLQELRAQLRKIRSLDLLSPLQMRERAREARAVGLGGEGLSAFIHGLSPREKEELLNLLRRFYPKITGFHTRSIRSGWKNLLFNERYGGAASPASVHLETEARHINDGTLRLMAILSHLVGEERCLLLDEIENGINSEMMKQLIDELVRSRQQVVVTTHSPVALNYLDDETAKRSVFLLFRDGWGETKAVRFFDLPGVSTKLGVLGPGEVLLDSSLESLVASRADL
ncbi:AAA family ATPase [Aminirod propionatiphilus]|uniref:AAA family ATPase n=1 Tax=Aminirod propionatiphilus TaxID=3415223 RepID=A0ACD1DXS3_9BACT|nr:AAA family ATPase [Synergistota bacterium]